MRKYLYILIIGIGFLQITGYLSGNKTLRGLGMATGSSPLPIVFTEVSGVETFAADFYIQFTDEKGIAQEVKITPALYSKLKGPYNRRNIFGAAIAYGPVLKEELWTPVLNYGLCRKTLLEEMEIPVTGKNYSVKIKTRTKGRNDEWILKPDCEN